MPIELIEIERFIPKNIHAEILYSVKTLLKMKNGRPVEYSEKDWETIISKFTSSENIRYLRIREEGWSVEEMHVADELMALVVENLKDEDLNKANSLLDTWNLFFQSVNSRIREKREFQVVTELQSIARKFG